MSRLSKIVKVVKNCQDCKKCSRLSNIVKIVKNCQNVGQVMFSHHSSCHKSLGSLFVCRVVKSWVTQWLSQWQGHPLWQLKKGGKCGLLPYPEGGGGGGGQWGCEKPHCFFCDLKKGQNWPTVSKLKLETYNKKRYWRRVLKVSGTGKQQNPSR